MRIQTQILWGLVTALALLACLVVVWAGEPARIQRQQQVQHALAIQNGADLYYDNCRTCHGDQGEGIGQLGPELNGKNYFSQRLAEVGWLDTLEAYTYATIAQGRLMATRPMYAGNTSTAVMVPWLEAYGGSLRPDQISDLTAFVANWEATATGRLTLPVLEIPKTNLSDPRLIERGRAVYPQHCGSCHTLRGFVTASQKGPDLSQIGRIAESRVAGLSAEEYIRESFLVPNAFIVEGYDPQSLGYHCGGIMRVSDLDAVVAFLLSKQ